MADGYFYQKIAAEIRQRILNGHLKPGDRIQSVRELCLEWNCTPGTIQRAFQELVREGLLVSQPGRGTRVAGVLPLPQGQNQETLRRATLVNHMEAFLLEWITAGYSVNEIQTAMEIALDRWRSEAVESPRPTPGIIRFRGSHDLVVNDIAHAYFGRIEKRVELDIEYMGSLGGLLALAEGKADIAGCHLWDAEEEEFNIPYIRRILPGKKLTIVTLAQRKQGLITAAGNPLGITCLEDLAGRSIRFVNRQAGSGTRVWLDTMLKRLNIPSSNIEGYERECLNHSEVARAVAEGEADTGLGLESAARAMGLDFIFLNLEQYDLVMLAPTSKLLPVKRMIEWLGSNEGHDFIGGHEGYISKLTGRMIELWTS